MRGGAVSRNVWVPGSAGGAQPRWGDGRDETSRGPRRRRGLGSSYRDRGGQRLPRILTILVFLEPQRGPLRKRGEVWVGGEGAQIAGAIVLVSAFECGMWISSGIAGANGSESGDASENGNENGNGGESGDESGMIVGHAQLVGVAGSAAAGIRKARWRRFAALRGILAIS